MNGGGNLVYAKVYLILITNITTLYIYILNRLIQIAIKNYLTLAC